MTSARSDCKNILNRKGGRRGREEEEEEEEEEEGSIEAIERKEKGRSKESGKGVRKKQVREVRGGVDAERRGVTYRGGCTMVQNSLFPRHLFIHFPTSSGLSE